MPQWWWLGVLVVLPGAQACLPEASDDAFATISLDFPKAPGCGRDAPEACPPLPEADEPRVVDGELVWSWSVDSCALDILPSASPVHISFESIERELKGWLAITVEPREIFVPVTDQWDVTDDEVDPEGPSHTAVERYPLQVSIHLVGEPSPEALQRIGTTGLATLHLKASTQATPAFRESFGIEVFQLDATPASPDAGDSRPAPAAAPLLAFAALAVAMAAARRRA